jgi:HEAT repeat protein
MIKLTARTFCLALYFIALSAGASLAQELQVTIKADKAQYFITEPVIVTVEIRNIGNEAYTYSNRTYDRSGRLDEYLPIATTQSGEKVEDPLAWRRFSIAGGLSSAAKLLPGQSMFRKLPINEWCLFKTPGRYEVYVQYNERQTDSIAIDLIAEPDATRAERRRKLIGKLHAASAETRVEAVHELGYLADAEALKPLIDALGDEGDNVSFYAVFSLMRNPELRAEMVDQLKGMLRQPDYPINGGTIYTLNVAGEKLGDDAIAALLKKKNAKAIGRSAMTLFSLSKAAALPYLPLALKDQNAAVRKGALSILTHSPDPLFKPLLKNLLTDAGYETRHAAAGALLLVNDLSGLPVLLKDSQSVDTNTARSAIQALADTVDDGTLAQLITQSKNVNAETLWHLLGALATVAKGSIRPELYRILDTYRDVHAAYVAYIRQAVFTLLAELGPEPDVELIRKELQLDHEYHRAAILATLSKYRGPAVLALVGDALDDASPAMQTAAIELASRIGDEQFIPRLELVLKTSNASIMRSAAGRALTMITAGAFDWRKAGDGPDTPTAQQLYDNILTAWYEWRDANLANFSTLRAKKELIAANTPLLQPGVESDMLFASVSFLLDSHDESAAQTAKAFLHSKVCEDNFPLEGARLLVRARDSYGIEVAIRMLERGDMGNSAYTERLLARTTGTSFGRVAFVSDAERVQAIGQQWRAWWTANADSFKFDR